jgi:DNA-binding IclR family transcriptional regulator
LPKFCKYANLNIDLKAQEDKMEKIHKPTQRVIDILSIVSENREGIRLTDISNETEIPKGTLSPILNTLVDNKMILFDPITMKYSVGTLLFKLGHAFIDNFDIIGLIKMTMKDIVEQCHEICQLGTLDDKNVLYLEKVEPTQAIKLESNIGKILPAHATALGKVLLSKYTSEELHSMYKDYKLKKLTPKTIDDVNQLIGEVENVKQTGIASEWGESNEQVMCLAVPIYYKDKPILSISVSIPLYRMEEKNLKLIENILTSSREKIERDIRYISVPDILL